MSWREQCGEILSERSQPTQRNCWTGSTEVGWKIRYDRLGTLLEQFDKMQCYDWCLWQRQVRPSTPASWANKATVIRCNIPVTVRWAILDLFHGLSDFFLGDNTGENLYLTSEGDDEGQVAKSGCSSWYEEKKDYRYPGNTDYQDCGVNFGAVGHLTQVTSSKLIVM